MLGEFLAYKVGKDVGRNQRRRRIKHMTDVERAQWKAVVYLLIFVGLFLFSVGLVTQ